LGLYRLSPLLLVIAAAFSWGQQREPCFAFLLRGDVAVVCDGGTTQITHRGDTEEFAVSDETAGFAFTTFRIERRTAETIISADRTTVIDLKSNERKVRDGAKGIVSTCGHILSLSTRTVGASFRDLLTGDELAFQPYRWFRCSADRQTVVGTTMNPGGELYEGVPPQTKIAEAGAFSAYEFSVSPNGTRIAYHGKRLCVFSAPGSTQCIESRRSLSGAPSVNDSGEVLISISTDQECFYKTSYDFSPTRFAGATDESRDTCLAIGHWVPGAQSIRIIEPLGRDPQWIRPATAELLLAWSARSDAAQR
jgi:hypothetical protein